MANTSLSEKISYEELAVRRLFEPILLQLSLCCLQTSPDDLIALSNCLKLPSRQSFRGYGTYHEPSALRPSIMNEANE